MEDFFNGLIGKFKKIPDINIYDKKKTEKKFVLPLFSGLGWEFEGKNPSVMDVNEISKNIADCAFEMYGITKFILKIVPLMKI